MSLGAVSRPQDHTIYTNLQALDDLKRQAREDQRSVLQPVAEQFEALFVEQILKNARQVKFDDGWLDGSHMDTYYDMYDKQLAQDITSKGSLGLADIIVEQLSADLPILEGEEKEAWLAEQQRRYEEFIAPNTEQALGMRPFVSTPSEP